MSLVRVFPQIISTLAIVFSTVLPTSAAPPTIVRQPVDSTETAGATASFSVNASGSLPLLFQWRKNGVDIAGKTTATLILTNVSTADDGVYSASVRNGEGVATSGTANLTVNPGNPAPPAIVTQPLSQTVSAGTTASFTVSATGSVPMSYQWLKNGVAVTGQTGATFSLKNVSATDSGNYSVKVSNSQGSDTSATATLTVTGQVSPTPPSIVSQPLGLTVTAGGSASFSVGADGTGPLSFQWMKDGVNLTGQTAATLTLNNVSATDAGNYSVKINNSSGTVVSGPATLTVTPNSSPVPPTIVSQPLGLTAAAGGNATFTVSANGTAPLLFQWVKDGANINEQTGTTLTITNVSTVHAGNYSVKVSNAAGSVVSANATLTVTPGVTPQPPTIASQPMSLTVPAGGAASFQVTANGTAPLTYKWMKDGAILAGQTGATMAVINVSSVDNGNYSVMVGNAAGTATSANATLTVTGTVTSTPPAIITQPLNLSVPAGGSATFAVTATGSPALSYQWMKNGANLYGQTGATLTLTNTTAADAGAYSVRISNSAGATTSADATLTVQNGPGSIDLGFLSAGISNVTALAVGSDGSVVIGGTFTNVLGNVRNRLARLIPDGTLDTNFNAGLGFNGQVNRLVLQANLQGNQNVVVGGAFTSVQGQLINYLARLTPAGGLDGTFAVSGGPNGAVDALAAQSDGKILIGGDFTQVNGQAAVHVARLNADGTLDGSFNTGAGVNGPVFSIVPQADGKVLLGGAFTAANGISHNGLVRLNADGSVDTTCDSTAALPSGHQVRALAVDAAGRILVGTTSILANPINQTNLIRLSGNGSLDTTFNAGVNGTVRTINVRPTGKILVGGDFQTVNAVTENGLVALNADGTVDQSFSAGLLSGGNVAELAVQPDGKLVAGGNLELRRLLFTDSSSNTLMIGSIVKGNAGTSLTFQSQAGQTYVLEFKNDLSAGAWLPGGTVTGNGNVETMGDATATGPQRFYRLRAQ